MPQYDPLGLPRVLCFALKILWLNPGTTTVEKGGSMNILMRAREMIGWSVERLAANCGTAPSVIEELEFRLAVRKDLLPVRVLEDYGCVFTVRDGYLVGVTGPLDISRLKEVRLSPGDVDDLKQLTLGPQVADFAGCGYMKSTLRINGLVDLGNVTETLMFEGEKETRTAARMARRLSKKGWAFVAMLEAEEVAKQNAAAQEAADFLGEDDATV
jgi:hypothetical protein